MLKTLKYIFIPFFLFLSFVLSGSAAHEELGIDEKLGAYLPLDLSFTNSDGKKMTLKEIVDKPVILALVYYHCPGICSPLLTGLAGLVDEVKLDPGKDYKIVAISFDHHETPELAGKWKSNYLSTITRKIKQEDWLFMTGDSTSIRKLTDAVGFYFKPDKDDFIHPSAIIAIAPDGKISRYLLGNSYLPFDFKMAVTEASRGSVIPTVNKFLQFCFSYDPQANKYAVNITRILGSLLFLSIGLFVFLVLIKGKKTQNNKGVS